jgi:hypothetical protein
MRKHARSILVAVVATTVVALTPAAAGAFEIDNATSWSKPGGKFGDGSVLYVWFSCGHGCGSYFEIPEAQSVNTGGQSGTVQACSDAGDITESLYHRESGDPTHVDANGGARIKFGSDGDRATFNWGIYDADDNLVKTVDHGSRKVDTPGWVYHYCWEGSA